MPNNTDGSLSNTAPAFHDSLNLSGNGHVPVADDDDDDIAALATPFKQQARCEDEVHI